MRTACHQRPRTSSELPRSESRIDLSVNITSCWTNAQPTSFQIPKGMPTIAEEHQGDSEHGEQLGADHPPEPARACRSRSRGTRPGPRDELADEDDHDGADDRRRDRQHERFDQVAERQVDAGAPGGVVGGAAGAEQVGELVGAGDDHQADQGDRHEDPPVAAVEPAGGADLLPEGPPRPQPLEVDGAPAGEAEEESDAAGSGRAIARIAAGRDLVSRLSEFRDRGDGAAEGPGDRLAGDRATRQPRAGRALLRHPGERVPPDRLRDRPGRAVVEALFPFSPAPFVAEPLEGAALSRRRRAAAPAARSVRAAARW